MSTAAVPLLSLSVLAVAGELAAVRREIKDFATAHGADAGTSSAVEVAVAEATTNVVRHAYAAGIGVLRVTADVEGHELQVVVEDDGGGLRAGSDGGLGTGLALITTLAADCTIASREPRGTSVWMRFPLPR